MTSEELKQIRPTPEQIKEIHTLLKTRKLSSGGVDALYERVSILLIEIDALELLKKEYQRSFFDCSDTLERIEKERGTLKTCLFQMQNAAIDLTKQNDALKAENEKLRMQLVACGVAAMCNTEESAVKQRIEKDNHYWSASYGDVCDAVNREIKLRSRIAALREALKNMKDDYGNGCVVLRSDAKEVLTQDDKEAAK